MINKKISGYTIKRKIGEGGMAEVYYAENNLKKKAAVKILKPRLCEDMNVVTRFENEAEVMVKLNHPNITQVFDAGTIDDRPCIVMAYLEGDDLKNRLKNGESFSDEQLQKWWNQLVDALNHTHQQGIIHRDIKPSNIFIDKKGNVILMDFGIAKIKDAISITSSGTQIGTLLYMSPEQVLDSKHIDYRTDLYSLAITFVHLLTRKAPYDITNSNDYMIRKGIVEEPVDLSELPDSWRVFLEPYLAKDPDDRPPLRPWEEPVIIDDTIIDDPPIDDPDDDDSDEDTIVYVGNGDGKGNGKGNDEGNEDGNGNDDGKGGEDETVNGGGNGSGNDGKGADDGKGNDGGKGGGGEKEPIRETPVNRKTILYASAGFLGALLIALVVIFSVRHVHKKQLDLELGEIEYTSDAIQWATDIFNQDSLCLSWNNDEYDKSISKLNEGYSYLAGCDPSSMVEDDSLRINIEQLMKTYRYNVYYVYYYEEQNYEQTEGNTKKEGETRMNTLKKFEEFDESEYQQYKSSKKQ